MMIGQAVEFGAAEVDAISVLMAEVPTSSTWTNPLAAPIRSYAKNHYITEQGHCCCYCGEQWLTDHHRVWDLEHVVPKALHPQFMFEPRNLAIACPDCNRAKSDRETLVDPAVVEYPTSAADFYVVHPHFDEWSEHIERLGRFIFEPRSAKGEWTVKNCNLGRFALKYVDPTDSSNPSDDRFDSIVSALTSDPATAQHAVMALQSYLRSVQVDGS